MVLVRLAYVADLPPPGRTREGIAAASRWPRLPAAGAAPPRAGARRGDAAPAWRVEPAPTAGRRADRAAAPRAPLPHGRDEPRSRRAGTGARPAAAKLPRGGRAVREARRGDTARASLRATRISCVRAGPRSSCAQPGGAARSRRTGSASILANGPASAGWSAISAERRQPTAANEQADGARAANAAARPREHPLVRAVLDAFPGARIEAVRDTRAARAGRRPHRRRRAAEEDEGG